MELKAKQRTLRQNAAAHIWFKEVARECLAHGITIDMLLKTPIEVEITPEFIKEMWRQTQKKMFGKRSTAAATSSQYSPVYEVLAKFFAELGIDCAWPAEEDK